jgi:hypothetical protein
MSADVCPQLMRMLCKLSVLTRMPPLRLRHHDGDGAGEGHLQRELQVGGGGHRAAGHAEGGADGGGSRGGPPQGARQDDLHARGDCAGGFGPAGTTAIRQPPTWYHHGGGFNRMVSMAITHDIALSSQSSSMSQQHRGAWCSLRETWVCIVPGCSSAQCGAVMLRLHQHLPDTIPLLTIRIPTQAHIGQDV